MEIDNQTHELAMLAGDAISRLYEAGVLSPAPAEEMGAEIAKAYYAAVKVAVEIEASFT